MRTSRDHIVEEGIAANERSMRSRKQKGPWLYHAKVKSGARATRNVEDTFTSIPHLMGEMVMNHAREGETFNVYGIARVMKRSLRSHREDI